MKLRSLLLSGLALLAASGCAELQEDKIDNRNKWLARRAWESLEVCYQDFDYTDDFGRGFRKGYFDVANGGTGCPPIIPPQRYWSVKYASPRGHQRTHAWFEGYRYGAVVAEQDGVGIWITLPVSRPAPVSDVPFRPSEGPTPGVAEEGLEAELEPTPGSQPTDEESAKPDEEMAPEEMPAEEPAPSAEPMPEQPMPEPEPQTEPKPPAPAEPPAEEPAEPFRLEPRKPDEALRARR